MKDFRKDLYTKVRLMRSGRYISIRDQEVYYEIHGKGEPFLLLHGGMSTLDTFRYQVPFFARNYQVILPERTGHGHTADHGRDYSYEEMADETIAFCDALNLKQLKVMGYSDGANLLFFIAKKRPDLIERMIFIGGNFHFEGCLASFRESINAITDEEILLMIDRQYEKYSPEKRETYVAVFKKVRKLWDSEPVLSKEDLEAITIPTLVVAGDQDCISLSHTLEMYESLKNAQLAIIPNATHSLLKEKPNWVNDMLEQFLCLDLTKWLQIKNKE